LRQKQKQQRLLQEHLKTYDTITAMYALSHAVIQAETEGAVEDMKANDPTMAEVMVRVVIPVEEAAHEVTAMENVRIMVTATGVQDTESAADLMNVRKGSPQEEHPLIRAMNVKIILQEKNVRENNFKFSLVVDEVVLKGPPFLIHHPVNHMSKLVYICF
jgi:hypothetical protein